MGAFSRSLGERQTIAEVSIEHRQRGQIKRALVTL